MHAFPAVTIAPGGCFPEQFGTRRHGKLILQRRFGLYFTIPQAFSLPFSNAGCNILTLNG
jgi:hypothetical protein